MSRRVSAVLYQRPGSDHLGSLKVKDAHECLPDVFRATLPENLLDVWTTRHDETQRSFKTTFVVTNIVNYIALKINSKTSGLKRNFSSLTAVRRAFRRCRCVTLGPGKVESVSVAEWIRPYAVWFLAPRVRLARVRFQGRARSTKPCIPTGSVNLKS